MAPKDAIPDFFEIIDPRACLRGHKVVLRSPSGAPGFLRNHQQMKKRIHPYLEPKLIIHTNGSTYSTGIPLLWLRLSYGAGGAPYPAFGLVEDHGSVGEEALLCFQSVGGPAPRAVKPGAHPSKQDSLFFFKAKEMTQRILFTSYPIKYSDLPSPVRFIARIPTAELQIAQPIHKKICLVLDTDIISNPL